MNPSLLTRATHRVALKSLYITSGHTAPALETLARIPLMLTRFTCGFRFIPGVTLYR